MMSNEEKFTAREKALRQAVEERDVALKERDAALATCAFLLEAAKNYQSAHHAARHAALSLTLQDTMLPFEDGTRAAGPGKTASSVKAFSVKANQAAILHLAAAQTILFGAIEVVEEQKIK